MIRETEEADGSKMDPYLELSINKILVHKTKEIAEGGKTPHWNEECMFVIRDMDYLVHYKVSDKDEDEDDIVGEGSCSLNKLINAKARDMFFIYYDDEQAGIVRFASTFDDLRIKRIAAAEKAEVERK